MIKTNKNILIREMDRSDISEVVELYVRVFSTPPRNEKINKPDIEKELLEHLHYGIVFIAVVDKQIVGIAAAIKILKFDDYDRVKTVFSEKKIELPIYSYIHTITGVDSRFRRLGIAEQLFNKRLEYVKTKSKVIFSRSRTDAFHKNSLLKKKKFQIVFEDIFVTNNVQSKKYIWKYEF